MFGSRAIFLTILEERERGKSACHINDLGFLVSDEKIFKVFPI